jgi:hypothetical protein
MAGSAASSVEEKVIVTTSRAVVAVQKIFAIEKGYSYHE